MDKSFSRKILSAMLCIVFLISNVAYADNVVIGSAPGMVNGAKTFDSNAQTTYLQNQYSGPGILPNSSVTGMTPIQGVDYGYGYTNTQQVVTGDRVKDGGPTTHITTSPKSNQNIASGRQSSGVVANGAFNTGVQDVATADAGPVAKDILSPSADGYENSKTDYGPGNLPSGNEGPDIGTTQDVSYEVTQVADSYTNNVIVYQQNNFIQAVKPNIEAEGALVVNASTRQIYFSKGGLNPFHPAALANLVTAALLVSYKGLNDTLVVSQSAVTGLEAGATTAGLRAGDIITVQDAIGAMFTKSCCDVANVVAENVAGNVTNFVALMNETVRSWGCVATNFTNPTGLNNDAQITNTYDMAIIMDKVSSNPNLKYYLMQPNAIVPSTSHSGAKTLTTKNQMLIAGNRNYYAGAASRMGYTSKAKYTMAAEIDYNGQRLIAVVLKANGTQYTDTTKLLNFAKVASLEAQGQGGMVYNTVLDSVSANMAAVNSAIAANQQAALNQAAMQQAALNQATMQQAATNAALTGMINPVAGNDTPGTWQKNDAGWYFIKASGQSASNEWIRQNGKVYCIDSNGYMITGWKQMSNGETYYFDTSTGELRYNTWINVSTGAYYLQEDGTLAKAGKGSTRDIVTSVGTYRIDDTGKALVKIATR